MKLTSACAVCFGGLATKSRIGIINLLQEKGKMSVLEIADHFLLRQPTITHHLKYLQSAGILTSQKMGRRVFYQIDPKCKRKECHVFA
ncbi:MAG: metalloregulator ArsR/SmtB family transcription factor [bacterium]|nr:metalloregulator ArsR/SmtB family transcription factor [bacterium]